MGQGSFITRTGPARQSEAHITPASIGKSEMLVRGESRVPRAWQSCGNVSYKLTLGRLVIMTRVDTDQVTDIVLDARELDERVPGAPRAGGPRGEAALAAK